jgi:tetratricopeptide (TPR) repeat protein
VVVFLEALINLIKAIQKDKAVQLEKGEGDGNPLKEGSTITSNVIVERVEGGNVTVIGTQINQPTQQRAFPFDRPPRAEHFTGREEELEQLIRELQPGKMVTLCGPGGIGKTALAAEAIWSLAPGDALPGRFPDGIIFHSFYTKHQVAVACENIARAYGEEISPSPYEAAQRALAGRKALVFLDGAEVADDLPGLLEFCGSCGVLITSQKKQDAPAGRFDLQPLALDEAVELFKAWAGDAARGEGMGELICELVGRLPLAVRLAGRYAAASGLGAERYLGWLEESPLEALDQGKRRHESVPILLRKSLVEVSESARGVLGMAEGLALAPFGLESVRAGLGMERGPVLRAVGELVNYGLLLGQEGRYSISHALVYTFARQEMPVEQESLERLAGYYASLAKGESAQGPEGFARLDPERAHALQALRECVQRGRWRAGLGLAWALDNFLDLSGRWTERIEAMEGLRACAQGLRDRRGEGAALSKLGLAYAALGETRRAIGFYEQALAIDREIGDRRGEGTALGNLGNAYADLGETRRAIELYQQQLALTREIGDRRGEGNALANLGWAFKELGEIEKVRLYWKKALEIYQAIEGPQAEKYQNLLDELDK